MTGYQRAIATYCGWTVLLLLAGLSRADSPSPDLRPDILLIMPDQMRGDCLSILNHPVVRTATLDALARQGTLFRRAYATVPSCIPARYALMTGQFPQTSGVVGFRKKKIDTRHCLPQLLSQAGYATALVGREMHQIVNDQQLGYQRVVGGSTYVSNDQYAQEISQQFPQIKQFRPWVESLGLTYNHWQAKPWPLEDDWHPTAWIVRQARAVIAQTPPDERLFLTASFYAPHPPLFPPQQLFDHYLQQPLPAPAHGDWVDWSVLTTQGTDGGHRVLLEGDTLRVRQAGYFGLIEHLDRQVASLITEFQQRSRAAQRPWLVIVTSDHGEMLGDHGYFRKCEPLEGSANVPLIITGSAQLEFVAGQRSQEPVCLEDLLPTLCQLAQTPAPPCDGVSLVAALRGQQPEVRRWLHFEHAPCYSQAQAFHALTDGHLKYIWRPADGSELLFDLQRDPQEQHNLSVLQEHADQVRHWRSQLVTRLADRPEGFVRDGQLVAGRPYRPLNAGAAAPTSH